MQAVVIHETGDPGVLRYEEADRPEPGDGEVLIKVQRRVGQPGRLEEPAGVQETARAELTPPHA